MAETEYVLGKGEIDLGPIEARLELVEHGWEVAWLAKAPDEMRQLIAEVKMLRERSMLDDNRIENLLKVYQVIPECPAHGYDCVPHAVEWVGNIIKEKDILWKEVEQLEKGV